MFQVPRSRNEWIVAIASALAGFFFGGAAIAFIQTMLRKYLNIG